MITIRFAARMACFFALTGCTMTTGSSDRSSDRDENESVGSTREALAKSTRWVDSAHGHDTRPNGTPNDCVTRHSPCATIQRGVDAASPFDVVAVDAGTYIENIVVSHAVTIRGEGKDTIVVPAHSAPNPCPSGALCNGAASTIILVGASDVRIEALTLDGDNRALTSGVLVGGADVDARNGIVTSDTGGPFARLAVDDVRVRNVYLRGIEASFSTFSFRHNDVRNVAGDDESIGIFNFGGAGIIEENRIADASDGIAVNHSTGTVIRANHVRASKSGVHSDNAGDGVGSIADRLEDNHVRDCADGGYGVWVFVPFVAPEVRGNTISGCVVGLAAFGQGEPVTTTFDGNHVDGRGVAGTIGALVTTDQLGFGAANVSVAFRGNELTRNDVGLLIAETGTFMAEVVSSCDLIDRNTVGIQSASADTHLNGDAIVGNGTGVDARQVTSGAVDATHSFWGCASGPGAPHCDSILGNVDASSPLHSPPRCLVRNCDDETH